MKLPPLVRALALSALTALAMPAAFAADAAAAAAGDPGAVGAAIYEHGRTGAGEPLEGRRIAGRPALHGSDAACVNCHRRSGLGALEGLIRIPPITGRYLFRERDDKSTEGAVPFIETMHADRTAYTDASLARAIREGIDADGHPLQVLMPRFDLGDADMAALIAYLRGLDRERVPGVGESVLHFATIVAPDADPARAEAMLSVLQQYFRDKNEKAFLIGSNQTMRPSGRTMYAKAMAIVPRRWQLHVWKLEGEPSTWRAQLERDFAAQPVFAVLSGIGAGTWEPVHRFCEDARLPCLFPNVDLPVQDRAGFYSMYFSPGLRIEAALVAEAIAGAPGSAPVAQVYRTGDSGEGAAGVLAAALSTRGLAVQDHPLAPGAGPKELRAAVAAAAATGGPLVLWLRGPDLAALGEPPPGSAPVFASGRLGGFELAPLPAPWRARTRMAWEVDLPGARSARLDYALGWFSIRRIPLVDLPVQVDTWLACGLVSEVINHLVDAFLPEYLVERVQDSLEHRLLTGYYPRLGLAAGQRFASKGGMLVRFSGPEGGRTEAAGEWHVP